MNFSFFLFRLFSEDFTITQFNRRPPFRDSRDSGPRINDRIRVTPIRLLDQDGQMVGIVELEEAKRLASLAGLDLVEIAADSRPPVVRIMDFGKFKYEQAKKEKQNKTKSKAGEMKEVRLGRSMKIDPHDVAIRVNQAREFLMEGYRVVFVQNFRGRELTYRNKGDQRMEEIAQALSDIGRVELTPRLNGKRMSMIMVPDRSKVDSAKKKTSAQKLPKDPAAKAASEKAGREKAVSEKSVSEMAVSEMAVSEKAVSEKVAAEKSATGMTPTVKKAKKTAIVEVPISASAEAPASTASTTKP
ncbi:MAG: translation initiation factor IF-3 [Planctomycetota bacterium]|nr:translation initiation factor IF-3 [Planctomycetota bacterium]